MRQNEIFIRLVQLGRAMVSVIITTYNSARFLKTCLESLLRQVYRPLEVIVVDNASSDGTRDVLANVGSGLTVLYK